MVAQYEANKIRIYGSGRILLNGTRDIYNVSDVKRFVKR
jgi:hypothetical protein